MKKLNNVLLNAKLQDVQSVVNNSIFLERLQTDGKSPEDVINEAKRVLELDTNTSVEASYGDKAVELNKQVRLLIDLNSVLVRLNDMGIEGSLNDAHNSLLSNIAKRFELDANDILLNEVNQ